MKIQGENSYGEKYMYQGQKFQDEKYAVKKSSFHFDLSTPCTCTFDGKLQRTASLLMKGKLYVRREFVSEVVRSGLWFYL